MSTNSSNNKNCLCWLFRWHVGQILDQPVPPVSPLPWQTWYWCEQHHGGPGTNPLSVKCFKTRTKVKFSWLLSLTLWQNFRAGLSFGSLKKQRSSSCPWVCTRCLTTSGPTPCLWSPTMDARWCVTPPPGTWGTERTSGGSSTQTHTLAEPGTGYCLPEL